jgi:hypothetical protein
MKYLIFIIIRKWLLPEIYRIAREELPESCHDCIEDLMDILLKWGIGK